MGFTSSYYSSSFYIATAFRLFRSQGSVHPTPDPAPFNYLPQATGRWLLGTESSPPALRTLNKPPLPEAHLPPAPSAAVHPVAGDLRPSRYAAIRLRGGNYQRPSIPPAGRGSDQSRPPWTSREGAPAVPGGSPASGLKGILGYSLILNYNRRFDVQIKKVWQNSMKTFYENQLSIWNL